MRPALTQALGFAIITEVFPSQQRGKALGFLGSILAFLVASTVGADGGVADLGLAGTSGEEAND